MTLEMTVQVALNSSALKADGSAVNAKVTAAGGGKAKVKNGVAVFKGVQVTAEQAGTFILKASSSSKKVIACAPVDV